MSLVTAIVSIDVEADKTPEAAETIVEIDGVTEIYSVTGDWDLIVVVRATNHDDLAETTPNLISRVDGVIHTQTQLAFHTYSQHDLESMFSIGLEQQRTLVPNRVACGSYLTTSAIARPT